jgi:hypothetical protein
MRLLCSIIIVCVHAFRTDVDKFKCTRATHVQDVRVATDRYVLPSSHYY